LHLGAKSTITKFKEKVLKRGKERTMESKRAKTYREGEKAPGGIYVENTLNQNDDTLPFGLFNPDTEGKLTWICNYGPDGDVVSVFCYDHGDHTDRDVKFLEGVEQAKYFRTELINNGWRKLVPPKIEFTVTSDDGIQKPMNRKERRYLDKKIKQVGKQQANLRENKDNDQDPPSPDLSS
jgi:hypothetical protein